jgi:hypothetical protein
MLGLKFVGKQRVLGLNATNRKVLNRMFGNIVKTWVGQEIVLYVAETQLAGETVKCVRIRDRGSRAASAAEEFLAGDEEPEAASGEPPKARSALLTAGWTEQQIATVNEACIALAITDAAKAALVTKHAGNYEAVYRDLNARADGGTQEVQ